MRKALKPSRRQKEIISRNGLNFTEWYFLSESETTMEIVSKATHEVKIIPKKPIKRREN